MCCDGLGSPSNPESPLSLPSRTIWQCHGKDVFLKSPVTKLSNKIKGQDFYGHMYKCDLQGISKQLFPYMQTLCDAIIFGALYCVKLYSNNLAAPPRCGHTYWHKLEALAVRSPRLCQASLESGSGAGRGGGAHSGRLHKPCFHGKPG